MSSLTTVRDALPDYAKDLKLNLGSFADDDRLDINARFGVLIASAEFIRATDLADSLIEEGRTHGLTDAAIEDAKASASLMSMTSTYYRTNHLSGNEQLKQLSPRLRMQRIAKPATDKMTFELFSMACAALSGCEMCIRSHEASLAKLGADIESIHDAVRGASIIAGIAAAQSTSR